MQYYSLSKEYKVSFKDALHQSLAEDKSLFFPEFIPKIEAEFWNTIEKFSNQEIAFKLLQPYIGDEIPEANLKQIIDNTFFFDFPLVEIEKGVFTLELFHGPTLAFKDVGAKFMSECFGYFNTISNQVSTVLVATSGDTGGAVANSFFKTPNINVLILYPKGKVSHIQKLQLTTLGENIHAVEVDGTFDNCQDYVKKAFLDTEMKSLNLTSANSINVARWLPQMVYYAIAYKNLKDKTKPIAISCPSGNFGNICAGIMANQMGLPIHKFIAATNINDTVPNYFETKKYDPKPSQQTISNAMDVGNPSNFVRILEIFNNEFEKLSDKVVSKSYNDEQTKIILKKVYDTTSYLMDPHGAVGYLGLKDFLNANDNYQGIFMETAHPIKFLDVVEPIIGQEIAIPNNIKHLLNKEPIFKEVNDYMELTNVLREINK